MTHSHTWKKHLIDHALLCILVAMCVGLSLATSTFLTTTNLLNVLRQVSMEGIIAFGMTMLIISGEIDLSVGSGAALAGCLIAYLTLYLPSALAYLPIPRVCLTPYLTIPLAFLVALLVLAAAGAFTGLMRMRYGVSTFITTLALMTGLQGAALMITDGFPLMPFPDWYNFLGGGRIAGVPVPAIIFVIVFLFVHFLMKHTTFGRSIYAVGGNAEAARLCGINVAMVKTAALSITGCLTGLSGVILSSRMMSGSPKGTEGWELNAITAVIIGGTSFAGGSGSIFGTLVGILFIGVVNNGMVLLKVPIYGQYVVKGLLILVAVWLIEVRQRVKA